MEDRGWSRERRRDALARLEQWTEWPLTLLALALVPILLAPSVFTLSENSKDALTAVGYLIWAIFATDLIVKLVISPDRITYLRRHWIDVLLVVIPFLRPLRALRGVRAFRLLRAGAVAVVLARVGFGGRRILVRHGLHHLLAVVVVLVALAGLTVTAVERSHDDAVIRDLPDGLWWAITTVTTVGYGDTYPKTSLGRGIGVILMLVGIAMFSAVTANVAAYFVEEREDHLLAEIRALREELQQRNLRS